MRHATRVAASTTDAGPVRPSAAVARAALRPRHVARMYPPRPRFLDAMVIKKEETER